jgi:DNA-binding MarR family transcriptional regulator
MRSKKHPDLIDGLVAEWRKERPGSTPEAMQVVGRIIRLGRLYEEEVSRMLRPHGLSYSDFDVLATLRRSGEPYEQSPTQLQKNVLLTSGAMTACLRRLESAGLISRRAGQPDRRRLSAKLTAKGHDMVERLIDHRFDLAQASTVGLTATQFAELEHLLRRLGAKPSA